ncbi:WXG100 family type VII secretion target [Microbispora hainanensis]|uniref:WXG100 family type VII secretion target n=1 Tax=Microbispora hainanensis TaxID=568844 RepID=UPI003253AAF8
MVSIGNVEIWNAQNNFITGAGLAGTASLLEPAARPLAAVLLAMVADPDAMARGAREWRNEGGDDANASPDIGQLRTDLRGQITALESNGHLKGQMLATMKQKFAELDTQLDSLDRGMKGVGDSLDSAAQIYTAASYISLSLGGAAMTLAYAGAAAKGNPMTLAVVEPMVIAVIASLSRIAERVFAILGRVSFKVAAIFMGVSYLTAGVQQKFPGMQAITMEAPDFAKAKVAFDPSTGGLAEPLPDPDDMPKTPSFMPPFSL